MKEAVSREEVVALGEAELCDRSSIGTQESLRRMTEME